MLYDGFIVLDTRGDDVSAGDMNNLRNKTNTSQVSQPVKNNESGYDTPVYGGTLPEISVTPTKPPVPTPPASTAAKTNWQQFVTPETLTAGAGLLGSLAGFAQKSPEAKTLKAVCGRKPLLNIGGKKDKYLACVDKYVFQKNQPSIQPVTGMSTNTKILIGSLIGLVLIIIIVMVVRRPAVPVVA